jgi:hypothetical protein
VTGGRAATARTVSNDSGMVSKIPRPKVCGDTYSLSQIWHYLSQIICNIIDKKYYPEYIKTSSTSVRKKSKRKPFFFFATWVAHYCNPSTGEADIEDHEFESSLGCMGRLHCLRKKKKETKLTSNYEQVVVSPSPVITKLHFIFEANSVVLMWMS